MILDLLPYQRDGAAFLAARERAGLFDEPGVGKTAQAIAALDAVNARRVLVVCPAAVAQVWVGEFKKFARTPRRIRKAKATTDLSDWLRGRIDVLICSYEKATGWRDRILECGDLTDVLILDEAHYLKTPEAKRTRALLGTYCDGKKGVAQWAAQTWFLTGTPASNDPADIWTFLRFAGATTLTFNAFCNRYFKMWQGTFSVRKTPREEMMPELRQLIRAHSLRRTKDDIGLQLPPMFLTTISVDGDTADITQLLGEHPGLDEAILDAVAKGGLSFLDAGHIATLRRLVGEAKAPAFSKLLLEELNCGTDKVVVMGLHTKSLQIVYDEMERTGMQPRMITGATSEAQRVKAVDDFQNDPACRVFIGNIRAAGTGLTLTSAAEIVMLESSWAPADNAQALMRVHRIGQGRSVRARFVSLAGSIDEAVTETVARKTSAIGALGVDYAAVPA